MSVNITRSISQSNFRFGSGEPRLPQQRLSVFEPSPRSKRDRILERLRLHCFSLVERAGVIVNLSPGCALGSYTPSTYAKYRQSDAQKITHPADTGGGASLCGAYCIHKIHPLTTTIFVLQLRPLAWPSSSSQMSILTISPDRQKPAPPTVRKIFFEILLIEHFDTQLDRHQD